MTAIQPFVNLQPFKVSEAENFEELIRQLTSCMQVAGFPDANRHTYLHLHLKGGPLVFLRSTFSSNSRGLRQRSRSFALAL